MEKKKIIHPNPDSNLWTGWNQTAKWLFVDTGAPSVKKLPYVATSPCLHTLVSAAMIRWRHWPPSSEARGYINGHQPFCSHPGSDQRTCENVMSTLLPCLYLSLHPALVYYPLVWGLSTVVLLMYCFPLCFSLLADFLHWQLQEDTWSLLYIHQTQLFNLRMVKITIY